MPEKTVQDAIFPPELDDYIDKHEKLGEGGFAEVHLAEHRLTGIKVAVKIMNKAILEKMGDLHRAYREIDAMKKLGCHQHICQLYQVVETETDIFLVLEHVSGGELFDYIVSREKLSEKESRSFFRQIVSAVAYIHSKGLAHRDLKPENMLLDSNNSIKIIDFGLTSDPRVDLLKPLATCCGSPAYAAPELISGKQYFGSEADLWSLGVVLYGLLNGFLPFDVDDDEPTYLLYDKIKKGKFDVSEWLSAGSLAVISRLLQVDPEKRMPTKDLLKHPWMCEGYGSEVLWQSILSKEKPDAKVVSELADFYDISDNSMVESIKQYKYDSLTAHYFLLHRLRQKQPRPKVSFKTPVREKSTKPCILNGTPNGVEKIFLLNRNEKRYESIGHLCFGPQEKYTFKNVDNNVQHGSYKVRNCQSVSIDDIDITPTRQNRSKSCSTDYDPEEKVYISPLRDTREKASSQVDNLNKLLSLTPAPPRSKPITTPHHNKKVNLAMGIMTPKFAKKIGRRVANLMTPKKIPSSDEPRRVKGVYKVSTTSTKSARIVSTEIETALSKLRENGQIYSYEASRYTFKCKGMDDRGNKLIFQLEICTVPGLDSLVGIHHSRLKGDSWAYKKMCDTVLGMIKI